MASRAQLAGRIQTPLEAGPAYEPIARIRPPRSRCAASSVERPGLSGGIRAATILKSLMLPGPTPAARAAVSMLASKCATSTMRPRLTADRRGRRRRRFQRRTSLASMWRRGHHRRRRRRRRHRRRRRLRRRRTHRVVAVARVRARGPSLLDGLAHHKITDSCGKSQLFAKRLQLVALHRLKLCKRWNLHKFAVPARSGERAWRERCRARPGHGHTSGRLLKRDCVNYTCARRAAHHSNLARELREARRESATHKDGRGHDGRR